MSGEGKRTREGGESQVLKNERAEDRKNKKIKQDEKKGEGYKGGKWGSKKKKTAEEKEKRGEKDWEREKQEKEKKRGTREKREIVKAERERDCERDECK